MSRSHGYRQLRVERCEPRRVLSANSLSGITSAFDLSSSSYFLAASTNGLAQLDTDSQLVSIPSSVDYSNPGDAPIAFRTDGSSPVVVFANETSTEGLVLDVLERSQPLVATREAFVVTDDFYFDLASDYQSFFGPVGGDSAVLPTGESDLAPLIPDASVENPPLTPALEPTEIDTAPNDTAPNNGATDLAESDETPVEPKRDLPPRRQPLRDAQAIDRVAISRLPAGNDAPGAGLIDLGELLGAPQAISRAGVTDAPMVVAAANVVARDAALAVESWVRATPTSTPATIEALPPTTLRADGDASPAVETEAPPARRAGRPAETQADRTLQSASTEQPDSPAEGVSEGGETPVVASVASERSSAYRLALAAFSTLLGGGLVWASRREAARPGCLERPPRRKFDESR